MSDSEKFQKMHGKSNVDILKELFPGISDADIRKCILEKERVYQDLCWKSSLSLAPGAIDFLNFLVDRGISYTIATSSGEENIGFYFEYLKLFRWFDVHHIVYNDGSFKGKPHPDIYLKAISLIGKQPSEVVIFEDAFIGLSSARDANPGKIIIVDSDNQDYSEWNYPIIKSFDEVDRNMFANQRG